MSNNLNMIELNYLFSNATWGCITMLMQGLPLWLSW